MRSYLTSQEAAALIRCSLRTLQELTARRQIPHRRPSGTRRLLFLEEEIDAWLAGAELEVVELPRGGRVVRVIGDGRAAS